MSRKHSANKEGAWLALETKVYYPENLALCKLLFERSSGVFRGCKWLPSAEALYLLPLRPLVLGDWLRDRDVSCVGPSTLPLTSAPADRDVWQPWDLTVEFWVDGSWAGSRALWASTTAGLPAQRGPGCNAFTLVDSSLFSFFLCRTWGLIYGP